MNLLNSEELGCNILEIRNVSDIEDQKATAIQKIIKKIKHSYANAIIFNVVDDLEDYVIKYFKDFPVISRTPVKSSMGDYDTIFYVLDCSHIPRDLGYMRSHPDLYEIDRK